VDPVHLDDHGVDDLAQVRWRRGAAILELPEQRDDDHARGGRAARRHTEPNSAHPPPPARLQAR
jgi:hypothetical protein